MCRVTGQPWPHQTLSLQQRWEEGSHPLGSHRWEQLCALPAKARHTSVAKFPIVCCSFVNTGVEAVGNSFASWKDAFKASSEFCGVCRDHLPRGRTGLADVNGLRADKVPCPEGPAPLTKRYNTSEVKSNTTSNICKWNSAKQYFYWNSPIIPFTHAFTTLLPERTPYRIENLPKTYAVQLWE